MLFNLINMKEVHIGNEIANRLQSLHMTKIDFAKRIGCPQQNVNRILEKASIDTDKLKKISEVLSYDFFRLYSDNGEINIVANGNSSIAAMNSDINTNDCEVLKERIRSLEMLLAEKERMIRYLLKDKDLDEQK